ncbi:MAG: phosphonate utilization protein [Betaproteobacteria bacterium]|nr:MAG: phosphonate utilization protein [Betaproteobacteria bacterium]
MRVDLSLGVTLAVLGAALLHATWNALVKSGSDPVLDTALVALGSSAAVLPFLAFVPPPEAPAWPWLVGSSVIHVGYFTALAGAYRAGDLSHGYPIMRGVAPLIVALSAFAWFGEAPGTAMWAGVLLICGGVLSLGLVGLDWRRSRAATAWALGNAAIIAAYTLVDAAGVRAAGGAERYVVWVFFFMGLPYALLVLALRRGGFSRHARRHWRRGLFGGACVVASYGIALWAMTRAPVAVIAALRETSVVFGALIGAWLLKEGHVRRRLTGAAAVLAGVIALKF